MSDDYTFKDVMESLESLRGMMGLLLRQRLTDKKERLFDEVTRRGRMTISQVTEHLGISRTHGLTLMKEVGKQIGFRFQKGDQSSRRPSCLIFDRSLIVTDQNNKMLGLFKDRESVSYADLMNLFGIGLPDAKIIAKDFVDGNKGYKIDDPRILKQNGAIN